MQLATPWAPRRGGQAAQRQARVGIVDAGQVLILEHGDERRGRLAGAGRALLGRQVGGPVHKPVQLGHRRRALHQRVFQRLPVGPAAGDARGFQRFAQHGVRHGFGQKAAAGAARAQKFQDGRHGSKPPFCFLCFPGGAARRPPARSFPVLCARRRGGPPPSQTSVFIIARRFQESTTVCVRPMPTAAAAILRQLAQPQMPSAVRPNARCAPLSAVSVRAPKMPSSPPAG